MKLSELLAPLLDAKADHETIRSMICAYEAAEENAAEKGREKARARWHKWNNKRLQTASNISNTLVRVEDSSSKKDIHKKEDKKESAAAPRGLDDFRAELSPILDAERIDAIVAVRRKKGATFSALAGRSLSKALSSWPNPNEAADEMVLRNWTGFKPEWMERRSRPASTAPPGKMTPSDANRILTEMEHERQAQRNHEIAGILPPDRRELRGVDSLIRGSVSRAFDRGDPEGGEPLPGW